MESRSVLVLEDDALLRELIAAALESHGFRVTTASTAADAMRAAASADPDAALIDIDLGPGPNGFDFAERLHRDSPDVALVFLTNLPDARFAERDPDGLPRGIAYLRKTAVSEVQTVIAALDAALRGSDVSAHRHDRRPDRPLAGLTRRQIEVLRLVAEGLTNQQIAERRKVTVKAVEETLQRAYAALGIPADEVRNSRVLAVRRFIDAAEPPATQS